MSKTFKKMFVLLVSVAMVFTMMAMPVYADDEPAATALAITNNTTMFKVDTASLETTADGEVLTIALSGSGYHELFKGTYDEAVENDDATENWIHGYQNSDSKWEFKVPVAAGETFIPLVAISNKYYESYKEGKNDLERAFFPRQMELDREAKTLVTGDYDHSVEVAVVNNVNMFKPGDKASVRTVGGPNSNNFGHFITLTMESDSYSKVRAKSYTNRGAEFIEGDPVEISVDGRTFANIPVLVDGETNVLEFWSVKNERYYPRDLTIDLEEGTATFNEHKATIDELEGLTDEEALAFVKANANVDLCNALIEAIQVQERYDDTDLYCELAKACWDSLKDEEKEEDDGYFSEDTGDASKDDPLNTAPDKEKELLVVSFGTSFNDSRVATIGAVEKALAAAYGDDYAVRRAFTAQIIINHVQARDGEKIDNVEQAMDKAVEAGVKEMIVQPTHLMSGAEYDELKGQIDAYADKINITYAKPLLNSDEDKEAVAKAVVEAAVKDAGYESLAAADAAKVAFVFMGHGTAHDANVTYTQMQNTMDKLGYANCFVGTVEGNPPATALPEVKKALEAKGYTKVVLRPLMVVAGDHAHNDMAADEEGSWYYAFVNGGEFEVEGQDEPVEIGAGLGADNVTCQINGLGEIEAIQQMYVAHTAAVLPEDVEAVELTVENKYNMFKPTAASLITKDEGMFLEVTYTSASYDKAYVGTAKEAVLVADPAKTAEKDANGKYLIPVEKTDEEFNVAFHSVNKEGWYDRIFKIDTTEKKLITDTTGGAIVPDDYGNEWDEEIAVESSLGMFQIESTKVTVEEDGTATIIMKAGNPSREFPKIALISQDSTEEEKEANAIVGTKAGDGNNYIYEFSIPVEQLGEQIPITHYQVRNGAAEWHNWSAQQYITINSVDVVNQLIGQIQVQKNSKYTEKYIPVSKKCWEALPEDKQGEDDGYFSEDTGDASKDDPRNTAPDKEKELLVVSFGTSFNDSRVATIGAVEKALEEAYGDEYAVRRAFTAQIIINHVWARDDERIDNVKEAMDKAVEAGVKEMIVQPTHLMSGAEYDELKEEIDTYAKKLRIDYAKPLLNSDEDKEAVAKALVEAAAKDAGYETLEAADAAKVAFVFMGHGTSHEANVTYTQMQQTMDKLGYANCFVGTVEGKPAETALPAVKKAVEAKGYTKVVLRPMMVVAGDHANNDMAADEEGSWYYAFVNGGEFEVEGQDEPVEIGAGFGADNVTCQITGLGEIPAVQQIYVEHTAAAFPKAADPIKVTLTVSNKGALATANDGSYMANKEVTVEDLDKSGDFNFDEALVAAHKAYNTEDGYAVSITSYGSSVTTLWGVPTSNTLFFINGKGLSTGVAADKIADGDKLFASVNADDTNYADWYTAFDKDSVKATYGANVTLTLTGYQGMNSYLNPDMAPVVGVTVKTVDGKTLGKTDKNGKVTFKAPAVGEYVVTAEGTVEDVITDWYMMDMGGETHPYGKMDFETGDMTIAYTDEDYGDGPYPQDEVKYIDFFEEAAEDSENDYAWQDLHYLKSNQLLAPCPIMAPAAKLTVTPAKISKATATKIADKYYTGKALKPTPTLKFNGKKLKKGTDFTVTYKANKAVGKATITVKGKGNFTGTKKVTFKINPKGTTLSKLTPATKALTVKWKAQKAKMNKARITGYEIQYSTSKKFTKKTTKVKKVTGYKKTSVKISKLKAKKTYYVRIRTYKKIGKVTYYSKWSKSLKKKTK